MINILNVSQTGLRISQAQVENVTNNLANENTPGYTKRVVNISELEQSDSRQTGRGVQVDDVSRLTDIFLYQNLIQEEGKLANLDELNTILGEIETIFGETDDAGLSADINRYFNSIENLRTSPNNEVYKNDVENNANVIVSNLQTLYDNVERQEKSTLSNIEENVNEINNILGQIGTVSQQILENNDNSNDLLDRRDRLEQELAQYIDVKISREDRYQIEIGGVTAVRFDTNVQEVTVVENYISQKDVYAKLDTDGTTLLPLEDSLLPSTWNGNDNQAEIQEIDISGESTAPVSFLGSIVNASASGDLASETVTNIINDSANIINTWNINNPDQEIATITAGTGNQVILTYADLEGDVPAIDNTDSNGIVYTGSIETTKGEVDSFTYTINNEFSLTVTAGEDILDNNGDAVDLNNDANNTNDTVTEDNALLAMVYKINHSPDLINLVTAYNGQYEIADDGSKILTSDPRHSEYVVPDIDRHLIVESRIEGEEGSFVGEFLINNNNIKNHQEKNDYKSEEAEDDIHIEISEKEVNISGGALKSMIDNVQTNSGNNKFNDYKEKLDQLAKTLSDITDSYIENADQSYIYGTDEVELSADEDKKISLNLFSGADVKSLKFNASSLNNLTQNNLDYLASIQFKEDIDFDGTGLNEQTFSSFYQTLRVEIADDKENAAFQQESQASISQSLQLSYDKITKVDSDTELIELIKYQAAYEANARMITVADEMLQTLLNI